MDIGCYLIYTSRLIFGEEPTRVLGIVERDPEMRTDILTSGILHFPSGQSVFTCSTQVAPYQRVQIIGTLGRIEIEIPFNAPPDKPCRIFLDRRKRSFRSKRANFGIRDLRSVHHPGRSIFPEHPRGNRVGCPVGGLDQEHGGNRGSFPLGRIRRLGRALGVRLSPFTVHGSPFNRAQSEHTHALFELVNGAYANRPGLRAVKERHCATER